MDSPSSFPVAALVASNGGLAALAALLHDMPRDPPLALCVTMQTSELHARAAAALPRDVAMKVVEATGAVPLRRGHLYLLSPDRPYALRANQLLVDGEPPPRWQHAAIDSGLRVLGEALGPRLVAIVLSGEGAAGSLGVRRIWECGGVTLAQSPDDAEEPSMPRSAIDTGTIDYVMPAAELGRKLLNLAARPPRPGLLADDDALRRIFGIVRVRSGRDLGDYRRESLLPRLARRLRVTGTDTLAGYAEHLELHAGEAGSLLDDLLMPTSRFFDEPPLHATLAAALDEALAAGMKARLEDGRLRIWVAGCASGESAYTLAMLADEAARRAAVVPEPHVIATDVDARALAIARRGIYPVAISASIGATRLRRYFRRIDSHYRVASTLRQSLMFAEHDLLRDPPFAHIDLVACRDLLHRLSDEARRTALQRLHFSLQDGGLLFAGEDAGELIGSARHLFEPIAEAHGLYRARRAGNSLEESEALPPFNEEPRLPSLARLHHRLATAAAPDTVLAEMSGDVLHLSPGAARYLRFPAGPPSRELMVLVHDQLRIPLRAAWAVSRRRSLRVQSRPTRFESEGRAGLVTIVVQPVQSPAIGRELMLITFVDVDETLERDTAQRSDATWLALDGELRRLETHLRENRDVSNSSTEELLTSNQELQATNEELTAAAEELETTCEEARLLNEALMTVNQQLEQRIDEARDAREDIANLIGAAHIATLQVDRALRIRRYTEPATALFALKPQDIGRPLADIATRLPYPQLQHDLLTAQETLQPIEREVVLDDGRRELIRIAPYRELGDRIAGALLVAVSLGIAPQGRRPPQERYLHLVDDTLPADNGKAARGRAGPPPAPSERERLLESEKKLRHELQRAGALRDEFLSVMAHELKHWLNVSHVNAELLLRMPEARRSAEIAPVADAIRRTVVEQARIIDDLLDLSRVRSGALSLKIENVDAAAIVQHVVESARPEAQAKGLHVEVSLHPEAGTLRGDPLRVRQIAAHLVANAMRFTPIGGRIGIELSTEGDMARLEVSDSGRGIEPEVLPHLFDLLRQADDHANGAHGGVGIGLALVRELAELQGGRAAAASAGSGRGARFTVWLPRGSASVPALSGLRVLLVDDTADTLEAFRLLLQLEGAQVTAAGSGAQALQRVDASDGPAFDLVIADIGMPAMNGYELIAALRLRPQMAGVRAIALSGYGRPRDERRAIEAGFDAHLSKPARTRQVIEVLQALDRALP